MNKIIKRVKSALASSCFPQPGLSLPVHEHMPLSYSGPFSPNPLPNNEQNSEQGDQISIQGFPIAWASQLRISVHPVEIEQHHFPGLYQHEK